MRQVERPAGIAVRETPLHIAGSEVLTGDWIEVRSPQSGELLARAAKARPSEVEAAIAGAAESFSESRNLPGYRRAQILREIQSDVARRRAEYVETIIAEAAKPRRFAEAEVDRALITLSLASEEATRIGGELVPTDIEPRGEGSFCVVRRFPVGPVTAITPFNFPLNLVLHKLAPALAAGNPVLVKPSPRTPLTAELLAEAVASSGWPKKAFSLIHADPDTARPLWTDERIRCVSFTGSDEVGWRIKREAGRKKVILELGGNAAAIVCEDADVRDAAVKLSTAAFAYAGQVCIKPQRLFVAREIFEPFRDEFLAAARKIAPADPAEPTSVLGPMIDQASAERVESWIAEARERGAKILLEPRREGSRLSPAVAVDVPPGAKIRDREVFGPVATLDPYDRFEDALTLANDSAYGLQASLFTCDIRKILRAFEALEVGGVIINDAPTLRIDNFPYGGTKASGFGREGVRSAIEEMTEPKTLFIKA